MAASQDLMGYQTLPVHSRQAGSVNAKDDHVAQEVPVALVFNGISHAVMMATPLNLEDFALGFSLSEQIISSVDEVRSIDVELLPEGIEIQLALSARAFAGLKDYRRSMTGRTGCGLCGQESLQQAIRPVKPVQSAAPPSSDVVDRALRSLRGAQPIQSLTGSLHAAAWCNLEGKVVLTREDVGRHNALDKLIGALQHSAAPRCEGFVLISSRASYEMVQKACAANMPTIVAVSAPTTLAIELAEQAGQNLIGFARPGKHVLYTSIKESGE